MSPSNDLGTFVRERRTQAGLTQQAVADAIGVSKPFVCQVETGRTALSGERLRALAELMGADEQHLFEIGLAESGRCCLKPTSQQSLKVLARLWRTWEILDYDDLNTIWRQLQLAEKRLVR